VWVRQANTLGKLTLPENALAKPNLVKEHLFGLWMWSRSPVV